MVILPSLLLASAKVPVTATSAAAILVAAALRARPRDMACFTATVALGGT